MKRLPAYLAALILGGLLYQIIVLDILRKPFKNEAPILAPQLYLIALEQQKSQLTGKINSELANFSENLVEIDTFSPASIAERITGIRKGYNNRAQKLETRREKWVAQFESLGKNKELKKAVSVLGVISPIKWPPPPPDPCHPITICSKALFGRQPLIIFFDSPLDERVTVSLKNEKGETILSSEPGSASQSRIHDQLLQVTMDFSTLDASGLFNLNIDGHLGESISLLSTIQ